MLLIKYTDDFRIIEGLASVKELYYIMLYVTFILLVEKRARTKYNLFELNTYLFESKLLLFYLLEQ